MNRLQRTLLHALPTTLGIVIVVFFLLQLVPGDAADVLAAEAGSATAETMTMLRAQFGLDQPTLSQLLSYLGNLSHFSLGFSPRYNAPVMDLIMSRLPSTLLGGTAVVETVFSWPGLGRLTLEAVMAHDFNVLLGVLLLSALLVIVANILVDLLQSWLDPRIKAH